jgi:hypothetical protein
MRFFCAFASATVVALVGCGSSDLLSHVAVFPTPVPMDVGDAPAHAEQPMASSGAAPSTAASPPSNILSSGAPAASGGASAVVGKGLAVLGAAAGIGATAAALTTGAIRCEPSSDSPSRAGSVNLCSGERAPAPSTR